MRMRLARPKLLGWPWFVVLVFPSACLRRRGSDNEVIEVHLNNHDNVQYSAPFSIGGQTLPVIYDTGSFEIIVLSTLCRTCAEGHIIYDSQKSSSFASADGVVAEHLFGSGPVRSEKGFDTVRIGGQDSWIVQPHAPFWQVVSHEIEVWNANAHFSGIVGLGHADKAPEGFNSMDSGSSDDLSLLTVVGAGRFAICLERSGPAAPGHLKIWKASAAVPGNYAHLEVAGENHWSVRMDSVHFQGFGGADPCGSSCGAIIDSGTSLIAVPPSARGFVNKLSSLVAKDCSNLHQLPTLQLLLDGVQVELPPRAYVLKVQVATDSSEFTRAMWGEEDPIQERQCTPAFMEIEKNSDLGPVWILGMPFLRYYHTVFDRSSKKVHVAPVLPNCDMKPTVDGGTLHFAATNGSSHAALGGTAFSSLDYEPTTMDVRAVRLPHWAKNASSAAGNWLRI